MSESINITESYNKYFYGDAYQSYTSFNIWENITITLMRLAEIKYNISVTKYGETLLLVESDVQELVYVQNFLLSKLNMLYNPNFVSFYVYILKDFRKFCDKNNLSNLVVLDLVELYCIHNNSIQSDCLYECLIKNKNKLLIDLELYKNFQ